MTREEILSALETRPYIRMDWLREVLMLPDGRFSEMFADLEVHPKNGFDRFSSEAVLPIVKEYFGD